MRKYLSPEDIHPSGAYVLVEAESEHGTGELLLPDLSRYPTTGWIIATGPDTRESLSPDDFVVVENESVDISGAPVDFFEVILDDEGEPLKIALERESEDEITMLYRAYQRDSSVDRYIYAVDIFTDNQYRFRLSDILDVYPDAIYKKDTRLEYIHTTMLYLPEGLHYIIHEDLIMCVVEP